jgi:hypothetical protein
VARVDEAVAVGTQGIGRRGKEETGGQGERGR